MGGVSEGRGHGGWRRDHGGWGRAMVGEWEPAVGEVGMQRGQPLDAPPGRTGLQGSDDAVNQAPK